MCCLFVPSCGNLKRNASIFVLLVRLVSPASPAVGDVPKSWMFALIVLLGASFYPQPDISTTRIVSLNVGF
jgi:hypothetical protein